MIPRFDYFYGSTARTAESSEKERLGGEEKGGEF